MNRTYQQAIKILDQQRRLWRPKSDAAKNTRVKLNENLNGGEKLKGKPSLYGMKEWLSELGYSTADINKLNVIHVAGTKGKGSTCAWIDSFLRAHGRRSGFPAKVGLYTSPHLIHPEERIRINFRPLPRWLFAKYFFEIHDRLTSTGSPKLPHRPRYLQLFLLLAFHTFIREGVSAIILETHHGGEYDSTNIVDQPLTTVITTLGIDHVSQLGSTLGSIAWHKAGIMKPGAVALSAPQDSAATEVLLSCARDRHVSLVFVDTDASLQYVEPAVQHTNASVALAAARAFLNATVKSKLSDVDIIDAVAGFSWPGRFQVVRDGLVDWYLDAAHNELSVSRAAAWFGEGVEQRLKNTPNSTPTAGITRILLFSQTTLARDSLAVLITLADALDGYEIPHVIFTTYNVDKDDSDLSPHGDDESLLATYASVWSSIYPSSHIYQKRTIRSAVALIKELGMIHPGGVQTLVTGSQYLVGGVLSLLAPESESSLSSDSGSGSGSRLSLGLGLR